MVENKERISAYPEVEEGFMRKTDDSRCRQEDEMKIDDVKKKKKTVRGGENKNGREG